MSVIELKNVSFAYPNNPVIKNLDYEFEEGKVYAITGKSGSGKTTLLSMLSGIMEPTSGYIVYNGYPIDESDKYVYRSRYVGVIFQEYNLLPKFTVRENIQLSLDISGRKLSELGSFPNKRAYIDSLIREVGLNPDEIGNRRILHISGGQQQRIAIARALVNEPAILLLDEPLGALDLKMRKEMQLELKQMHDTLGITFIYGTHDQEEALTMSDRIVVMSEGKTQQIGTPEDIYNEPKNAFVADFIGESNIFNGIMTGKMKARFCGGEFTCVDDVEEGTHITAVVRPEDVEITSPEKGIIRGHVISVIFKGMHYEITIESGRNEIVARSVHTATVGDVVGMYVDPDNIHIMIAEDHTNYFTVDINSEYRLEFNGKMLDTSVTKIIPGSKRQPDGTLVDGHGETIDPARTKITASIEPQDISMTDKVEEGLIEGYISNLIYKGDHYSYVIHTDLEQDLVVDDEYLWNMDDHVGLIMPVEKMSFKLNR